MGARIALTKGYKRHFYVSDHALQRGRERLDCGEHSFRADGDFGNLLDQCVWTNYQEESLVEKIDDLDGTAVIVNLEGTAFDGLFAVIHDEHHSKSQYTKVIRTLLTKDHVENNKLTRWGRGINTLKEKLAPLVTYERLQEERKAKETMKKDETLSVPVGQEQDVRLVLYPGSPTGGKLSIVFTDKTLFKNFLEKLQADPTINPSAIEVFKPSWLPVKKKVVVEFEE